MFINDIGTDELYLIKGMPEISQFFVRDNVVNENLGENEDDSPNINVDQSNHPDQSPNQHFKFGPASIKRSVKVICLIGLMCNEHGLHHFDIHSIKSNQFLFLFQDFKTFLSSKNTIHEFSKSDHFLIEVFRQQTIFVSFKSVCYIWLKQKNLDTDELNIKSRRNHKVLSGHWHTIDLGEIYDGDITPLITKYIVDQTATPYWSLLFLLKSEDHYRVYHKPMSLHHASTDLGRNIEKANLVFEFQESSPLKNQTSAYSSCGKNCLISLHFCGKRPRIYFVHIIGKNIQVEDLSTEVNFLSEEESLKSMEFICKGIYRFHVVVFTHDFIDQKI